MYLVKISKTVLGAALVFGANLVASNSTAFAAKDPCAAHKMAVTSASAKELKNTESFLWEIKSPDGKISHLMGVTHGLRPKDSQKWDALMILVQKARLVMTEIPLGRQGLAGLGRLSENEKSVYPRLSPYFQKTLAAILASNGQSLDVLKTMKTWAVYSSLSQYVQRDFVGLDQTLNRTADFFDRPVKAIESVQELESHFKNSFTEEFHTDVLKDVVCNSDAVSKQAVAIVDAFAANSPKDLVQASYSLKSDQSNRSNRSKKFNQVLLENRNEIFADRLMPELKQGGVFSVFGALHLFGETGVIEALRKQGYTARPMNYENEKEAIFAQADFSYMTTSLEEARNFHAQREGDVGLAATALVAATAKPIPLKLRSQYEVEDEFCGGGSCGIPAYFKDGVLIVTPSFLASVSSKNVFAQGILVHEYTHYLQDILKGTTSNSNGAESCESWKAKELEALTIQKSYLSVMSHMDSTRSGHYGRACEP